MSCPEGRLNIGVYLLGALEPGERARFEEHLAGCVRCRGELADLAGLPGLLSRLGLEEAVGTPAAAGPHVYAGLRARALRTQQQRHRRWIGAAAAAVLLVGTGAVLVAARPSGSVHATAAWTVTDPVSHVTGTFTLTGSSAGTKIGLRIWDVRPHERCQLVAVGRDGQTQVAGSWWANYEGTASIDGSVAIARDQLTALDVQTLGGTSLVSLQLPTR